MEIRKFIEEYKRGDVAVTDTVDYSQREIVEKNFQMRAGKYVSPFDSDGDEKRYFNVLHGFIQTLTRGSRLKIEEFDVRSRDGRMIEALDVVRGAMKHHLLTNHWVEKRDEVLDELCAMGHVLMKIVDGESYIVDLRNVVYKPDMRSAKEEGIAEMVPMLYEEAKAKYGESKKWSEIEDWYEEQPDTNKPYLNFVEHWTFDEFDGEKTKGCIVYLDRSDKDPETANNSDDWEPYIEIDRFASPNFVDTANEYERKVYGEKRRVFPYDEQRLIDVKGRYLGMGVYELCRPEQEEYNRVRKMKRKFDSLALRGILVHKIGNMRKDGVALGNNEEFLRRLDTGAMATIYSDESLERLNMGSTTGDTIAILNDLFEVMRFMIGITPQALGQSDKNKTAFYAQTQQAAQESTYLVVKNKIARLFERVWMDFLLEDIMREMFARDTIGIFGDKDELAKLDEMFVRGQVNAELSAMPPIPNMNKEMYDAVVQAQTDKMGRFGQNRFIDISTKESKNAMKKIFKDLKFYIEFTFTDEAMDKGQLVDVILKADQMQNEKLRDQVLDVVGISPQRFKETDEEKKKRQEEEIAMAREMEMAKNAGLNQMTQPQYGTPTA